MTGFVQRSGRWISALGAVLVLALAADASAQNALSPRDAAAITIHLSDLLAREPGLPLPVRQKRDDLYAYYQGEAGPLLWIGTDRMVDFIGRLTLAEEDGLDPTAYPIEQLADLADAAESADDRGRATVELYFSSAFLEYASDLQVGQFLPRKVDPNFFQQDKTIDTLAALQGLRRSADLASFFDGWQPQNPQYAALRAKLGEYRALDIVGEWPVVPLGDTLKPGMRDPRVPALRARLAMTEGVAEDSPEADLYDDELVAGLQAFQVRHGLEPDGAVGKGTVVALNVPLEERIQEIEIAMERWRWMPADLGDDHLMVNIAGFDLKLVRGGVVADEMAVVVGKPYSRTPVFSDAVRIVEFNPYWNVPAGIAVKEELPRLKSNPAALPPRASKRFKAIRFTRSMRSTGAVTDRAIFPSRSARSPAPRTRSARSSFFSPTSSMSISTTRPPRACSSKPSAPSVTAASALSRPIDLAEEVLAGCRNGTGSASTRSSRPASERSVEPGDPAAGAHRLSHGLDG